MGIEPEHRLRPTSLYDTLRSAAGLSSRADHFWASFRPWALFRRFPRRYFERIYVEPDPWDCLTSPYELAKYEKTLSLLPRERYGRVLDVGCGIGVLTGKLAWRADCLDAIDIARPAVERARRLCRHHRHLSFRSPDVLHFSARRPYDLVVCSEVLYYMWDPVWVRRAVKRKLERLLAPNGHLITSWGGYRLVQDWDAVLQQGARLRLVRSEMLDDPVRPYRVSLFQSVPSSPLGEP
ncbi:MAG: SAM-dependent methyltransferase [Acidobacteriota bacterium]